MNVKDVTGHAHEETLSQEYFFGRVCCALQIIERTPVYSQILGPPPQPMSLKKAAVVLRVGVKDVQYVCSERKINAFKVKGDCFILVYDLLNYQLRRDEICCL